MKALHRYHADDLVSLDVSVFEEEVRSVDSVLCLVFRYQVHLLAEEAAIGFAKQFLLSKYPDVD